MDNKTPQTVRPSKIEAVSDSVDVNLKERLLNVEIALSYCDQHTIKCTVPFGTKFVLNTENDLEPTASIKLITVCMTCSFTDGTTKLDSDNIRHVLEEKFQSEGQLHINVYVIETTENEAGKTLSSPKMITLDINVHGINVTHEEIHQTIATYLGPEYKLDMIDSKHEDNCLMGVLISQEVTLTSKETDYVVPINCLDDKSQEKRCQLFVTKDNVKLTHTYVEDVYTFIVNISPFLSQRDTRDNPSLTVLLNCYFRKPDTSLFDNDKIADTLQEAFQTKKRLPINCSVIESFFPDTISPSGLKLISFDYQTSVQRITVKEVCQNLEEYFGSSYTVMPPRGRLE